MKIEHRKNILSELLRDYAKSGDEASKTVLEKELSKIRSLFAEGELYYELRDSLDILCIFTQSFPDEVYSHAAYFLENIQSRKVVIENEYLSKDTINDKYNTSSLICQCLDVLIGLCHYTPKSQEILNKLFHYSTSEDQHISSKAKKGIISFAQFDLGIVLKSDLKVHFQELCLNFISENLDVEGHRDSYFSILEQCLASEIEGTTSDYNSLTIHTAAMPASDEVKALREKSIKLLIQLYAKADDKTKLDKVLPILKKGTSPSRRGGSEEFDNIIAGNADVLILFVKAEVVKHDLSYTVLEKIESLSYSIFRRYRDVNKELAEKALQVEEAIEENEEYVVYKTLIGFEGTHQKWSERSGNSYIEEQKARDEKVDALVDDVTSENFQECWVPRILEYAKIESNDLATFPSFSDFLRKVTAKQPELILSLLKEHHSEIDRFLLVILDGLLKIEDQDGVSELICSWVDQDLHLWVIARLYTVSKNAEFNINIIQKILKSATECDDLNAISYLIASVILRFDEGSTEELEDILLSGFDLLNQKEDTRWVRLVYFNREEIKGFCENASEKAVKALLANLLFLQRIERTSEGVLTSISETYPVDVILFFKDRIAHEEAVRDNSYDAVPYEFYDLHTSLSKHPAEIVLLAKKWFDDTDQKGLFQFREGKLLHNIFPNLDRGLEVELSKLVDEEGKNSILFVLYILRTYEGNEHIYGILKKIVAKLPADSELTPDIRMAFDSTGVVCGEYGFADATKARIDELKIWLQDDNEKIKSFAKEHIEVLREQEDRERKRALKDIEIRKHQFGVSDDQAE